MDQVTPSPVERPSLDETPEKVGIIVGMVAMGPPVQSSIMFKGYCNAVSKGTLHHFNV